MVGTQVFLNCSLVLSKEISSPATRFLYFQIICIDAVWSWKQRLRFKGKGHHFLPRPLCGGIVVKREKGRDILVPVFQGVGFPERTFLLSAGLLFGQVPSCRAACACSVFSCCLRATVTSKLIAVLRTGQPVFSLI